MVEYKTYPMHEKVQMERHFLVKKEFNIPHAKDYRLDEAFSNMARTIGWGTSDDNFDHIEVLEGDIITIKAYKTSVDGTLYTYLVCYYNNAGYKINCGYETTMSLDFILINEELFEEVTEAMIRDQKINQILEK